MTSQRTCTCGSGLARAELHDARGIFCTFVCAACEARKRAQFRPEIFRNTNYDAPDLGDDEDDGDYR